MKLVLDFLKTPFGDRPGWFNHLGTCPVRFVGSEGWVETGDSGGIEVHPASLKEEIKSLSAKPPTVGLDVSAHARNFFDCIKTRGQTAANPKVMKNSHIACHAAALSWILQRKLTIDPARDEFVNDDEANGLRSRPARNVLQDTRPMPQEAGRGVTCLISVRGRAYHHQPWAGAEGLRTGLGRRALSHNRSRAIREVIPGPFLSAKGCGQRPGTLAGIW